MNEEEIVVQENKQVLPVFNKTIHDEDNHQKMKMLLSVCITSKDDEDDSIENQPTTEIDPHMLKSKSEQDRQTDIPTEI